MRLRRLNILLALAACLSARSRLLQGGRDPLQHEQDDSSVTVEGREKAGLIKMLADLRRRPTTPTWNLENATALYKDTASASGRSGSTTALEMVNAIPGVYLAGENYGVMNSLLDMYKAHEPQLKAGKVSENNVLCALQLFVKTIIGEFNEGATKVIGFKEIRHYTGEQFQFFKKVFPGAKFIINTRRDLDRQHGSQFQVNIPMEDLKNWTAELTSFQASNPDDAFQLTLEESTRSSSCPRGGGGRALDPNAVVEELYEEYKGEDGRFQIELGLDTALSRACPIAARPARAADARAVTATELVQVPIGSSDVSISTATSASAKTAASNIFFHMPDHDPQAEPVQDYSVLRFNKLMRFAGFRKCWFLTVVHANDGWRWNDDQDSAKKALTGNCTFTPWSKKRCEESKMESQRLRLMNKTMRLH